MHSHNFDAHILTSQKRIFTILVIQAVAIVLNSFATALLLWSY